MGMSVIRGGLRGWLAAWVLLLALSPASAAPASDDAVKQAVIRESIAAYPGSCPCPYSVARNGSSCGRRSAYSRPGGYAPLCYATDVTPDMVRQYRAEHGQ